MKHLVRALLVATVLAVAACGSSDESAPTRSMDDPPEIARWIDVGGIDVPLGVNDGPASREKSKPFTGFSQSPQGAALAAITQSIQLATASDKHWSTILPGVVAPGEARDQWAAHRALVTVSGTDPEMVPEIVGYVVHSYTPDAAVVGVVQRFSDDSVASTSTHVMWVDGDWRLNLDVDQPPVVALDALPSNIVDLKETRK